MRTFATTIPSGGRANSSVAPQSRTLDAQPMRSAPLRARNRPAFRTPEKNHERLLDIPAQLTPEVGDRSRNSSGGSGMRSTRCTGTAVLSLILAVPFVPARAQGTLADYRRAAGVTQR